ncbi:Rid family hydrolase [Stutzerimonas marianensis]|uniref:Rid family hydrolase n=1 Tax=Stutzerimonas marianensis TaxID=2929513 RepID=UPI003C300FBC
MKEGPIKTLGYLDPYWRPIYGYGEVKKIGNRLYVTGQMSHGTTGDLVGPASVDADGLLADCSNMALQLRVAYANAQKLLRLFDANLDDVIEEVLYVVDLREAARVVEHVRKEVYGKFWPSCKSRLICTPQLLFPEQLVEITLTAETAS